MAFEKFTKRGTRRNVPSISIWRAGDIGFSNGFVATHNISKDSFVVLYFNEDSGEMGIRFTKDASEEGAMKVVYRSGGISVAARSFLNHYDIDWTETRQCNYHYDEENSLYVVKVKD